MHRKPVIVYKVFDTSYGETAFFGNEVEARIEYNQVASGTLAKVELADLPLKKLLLRCLNGTGYAAIHEVTESKLEE